MKMSCNAGRLRRGFTLLELLVAMTATAILLVLLLNIVELTLHATRSSHDKVESAQRARAVLDALSADLANRVTSPCLPIFVSQQGGDSRLVFLTRSRGPVGSANFRFFAVAYELAGDRILRRTAEVFWDQADLSRFALSAISSQEFSVLAEGILRFETVAVLHDGSLSGIDSGATVPWMADVWQGKILPEGFQALLLPSSSAMSTNIDQRVKALIVGVAALDRQSLGKLTDLGIDLTGSLPPVTGSLTPVEAWSQKLYGNPLLGVPPAVVSALLLSQQTYSLP